VPVKSLAHLIHLYLITCDEVKLWSPSLSNFT
jgi:hypothetical protein